MVTSRMPFTEPERFDLAAALSKSLVPIKTDDLRQKNVGRVRLLKADELQGSIREAIDRALATHREEMRRLRATEAQRLEELCRIQKSFEAQVQEIETARAALPEVRERAERAEAEVARLRLELEGKLREIDRLVRERDEARARLAKALVEHEKAQRALVEEPTREYGRVVEEGDLPVVAAGGATPEASGFGLQASGGEAATARSVADAPELARAEEVIATHPTAIPAGATPAPVEPEAAPVEPEAAAERAIVTAADLLRGIPLDETPEPELAERVYAELAPEQGGVPVAPQRGGAPPPWTAEPVPAVLVVGRVAEPRAEEPPAADPEPADAPPADEAAAASPEPEAATPERAPAPPAILRARPAPRVAFFGFGGAGSVDAKGFSTTWRKADRKD